MWIGVDGELSTIRGDVVVFVENRVVLDFVMMGVWCVIIMNFIRYIDIICDECMVCVILCMVCVFML